MRHEYPLTEETIKVLSDYVKPTAREMDVDIKYVYAILAGTEPDRFSSFRHQFKSAAEAGAPVEIWLNDLIGINLRVKRACNRPPEALAVLLEKIDADAESTAKFVDALKDGEFCKTECHELLSAMAKIRKIAAAVELILQNRLGELGEQKGER